MTLPLYQFSAPLMARMLKNMIAWIEKAERSAAARGFDPQVFVQARLAPDMLPFAGQIQRASDASKGAVARLSGQAAPSFADTETTIAELKDRLQRTIAYIDSVPASAFEGAETREVTLPLPSGALKFVGAAYLTDFALPNFYFHATTAYAILRHNGVDVGKIDYLGGL